MKIKDLVKNYSTIKKKVAGKNMGWAMYMANTHGKMIYDGEKTLVIKSIKLIRHIGEELFLCSDMMYGTIVLSEGSPITKEEFKSLRNRHKITDKEAKLWWGSIDNLYKYEFKFYGFARPIKYRAPKGFQTFIHADKIITSGSKTLKLKLSDITKENLKSSQIEDILGLHRRLHMLECEDKTISQDSILMLHSTVVNEMLFRGYKFNIVDNLDERTKDYIETKKDPKESFEDQMKSIGKVEHIKDYITIICDSVNGKNSNEINICIKQTIRDPALEIRINRLFNGEVRKNIIFSYNSMGPTGDYRTLFDCVLKKSYIEDSIISEEDDSV